MHVFKKNRFANDEQFAYRFFYSMISKLAYYTTSTLFNNQQTSFAKLPFTK